jgi:GAF domain-containing protein
VGAQAKLAQLYAEFPSIADMGGSLGGGAGMGVGVGVGVSGGSAAIAVARSLSGAGLEMLSPLGNVSASSFSPLAAERSISAATLASRGGLSATASASASAGDLLLLPTGGGGGGGASSARLDSVPSSGMSSSSLAHSSAPSSCPASAAHTHTSSSGFSSPHHAVHPASQMPTTAVTPQQHSFDGSGGGGGEGGGMSNSSSTLGSSDALSVLKATSSFATEKDTTKLLQRLMRCVLECAGATRGVLVLRDAQGDWSVELGGSVEADTEPHEHDGAADVDDAARVADHPDADGATPCSQLQHELEGAVTDTDDVKRDDTASVSVSAGIPVSVDGNGGAAVAVSMQPCAPLLPSECLTRTPSPVKRGVAASSPPSADAASSVPAPLRVSSEGGGAVASSPPGALFSPLTDRSPMLPPPSLPAVLQPLESQLSCSSSSASQQSHSHGSTLSSGSHVRVGSQSGVVSVESALPMSCFQYVLSSVETLLLSDPSRSHDASASAFASDPYFAARHPRALLCMPVLRGGEVFGVLYLENDYRSAAFTSSHIQLLQLLCGQAALSIDNARLYSQLSANNASLELRNAQLLAAKEAAEAATKVKADFLSNMSHEIRTPMNAVLGIGRLLADTPLSLEQQQYVAMMNNSGHLLLTIINDILDYSKIEVGARTTASALGAHPHTLDGHAHTRTRPVALSCGRSAGRLHIHTDHNS